MSQSRLFTWRHWAGLFLIGALVFAVCAAPAGAQAVSPPVGRVEVSVGAGLLGGAAFGEQTADVRAGGTGSAFRLFTSDSQLASSSLFEARVGVALSPRYVVEGQAAMARPELRTSVSGDSEGAPATTAVERLDHYLLGGGILVRLDELRVFGLQPFAAAGAGYLRELHEEQALVEDGHFYYVGGGFTRWLFSNAQGLVRSAAIRADLRVNLLSGGVSLDDGVRRQGALSGSVVVVF